MSKGKKVRKFIDVEMELDFKIKTITNNLSILKGKTITEKELLLEWIENGVNKSLKKLK
tara:strand:- start:2202 stop:2378 length:177 start_codon:yes stop_codon:yes gene_type:complete